MNLIKTSILVFMLNLSACILSSERTATSSPSTQTVIRSVASIANMAGFTLDRATFNSIQAASDFLVKPLSERESPELRLARTASMYFEYELRRIESTHPF